MAKTVSICFTILLLAAIGIVYTSVDNVGAKVEAGLSMVRLFVMALAVILIVALALGSGVIIYALWTRYVLASRRPIDGAFPLQSYRLRRWDDRLPIWRALLFWLVGERLIVNVNEMIGPAALLGAHGYRELEPAAGWAAQTQVRLAVERTNGVRAMFPGDEVRRTQYGAMSQVPRATAGTWKVLDAKREALPEPVKEEAPQLPVQTQHATLDDALKSHRGHSIVLGQSANGELVQWNPRADAHLGIWGKTGTGKSSRVGLTVALGQLRQGYQMIVIDPEQEGGKPTGIWGALSPWAQVVGPGEPGCSLWDEIIQWYENRWAQIAKMGASDAYHVPRKEGSFGALRPLAIHFDEFGRWRDAMKSRGGEWAKYSATVDDRLKEISQRGRKRGVHLTVYSQLPGDLPEEIAGNLIGLTLKQAPNQGNKVGHWAAHNLKEGEFAFEGSVYDSFQPLREVAQLMAGKAPAAAILTPSATVPAVPRSRSTEPFQAVPPEVDTPTRTNWNAGTDTETDTQNYTRWIPFARDWLMQNRQYTPTDSGGQSALARAMWESEGRAGEYGDYKSRADRALKAVRGAMPQTGAEALAAMGLRISDVEVVGRKVR